MPADQAESTGPVPANEAEGSDPWIEVGRVIGAFGVRGAMKVGTFTDPEDSVLAQAKAWRLTLANAGTVDLEVSKLEVRFDALIAEFRSAPTREQVQAWKGGLLSVRRSAFPATDDDEYYWSDLIGCEVVDGSAHRLGAVTAVQDFGADPLLQVDGRLLIPFVEAYVLEVDVGARRIVVDWAEDWS